MSVRLQGQFLLAGALGSIVWSLLVFLLPGPLGITGFDSIPTNIVGMLSGLLLLVGLPVLYRAQAKQIGRVGLVGVVLLCVAVVLVWLFLSGVQILDDVVIAVPVSIPPGVQLSPPPVAIISAILGGILVLIGGVMIGITTIRAHILPPAIGWIILIGSVALFLTFPLGAGNRLLDVILTNSVIVLLYVGLAWAGAVLGFRAKSTQRSASEVQRN
jgi:hypothetical protein